MDGDDTKKTFVRVPGRDIVQFQCEPVLSIDLKSRLDRQNSGTRREAEWPDANLMKAFRAGDLGIPEAKLALDLFDELDDLGDDGLDWIAGLFDQQRDATALRYDPEHAYAFDGYERLGPAAVLGQVAFTRGPDSVIVHRITDAEILGGTTWTPTPEESEVLDHWTSTAAGRIDLAHKTIAAGSVPLAVFWGHTYD